MAMPDIVPTRSAYLALREERQSMQEGYRFLDEKRLIMAGELIKELERYEALKKAFDTLYRDAVAALRGALQRHGLEELEVYPGVEMPQAHIRHDARSVIGVQVSEAVTHTGETRAATAIFPSPEGERCRRLFQRLLEQSSTLAASSGNLQRLWDEYQSTSRRARALEDVLLPEMEETLRLIDSGLEELDREEAIRVRHFRDRR